MHKTYLSLIAGAVSLMFTASAALAQSNPYEKGPAPSLTSVQADGPFRVATQTVKGTGFGGGTVYSPSTPGTYGLIAVCPGFLAAQSSIDGMSRRLATHGFVVVAISTTTVLDLPGSRGNQLLAALRAAQALKTGPVVGKIDTARLAVAGWSMGGGGTLRAVETTPTLKAGTPWAPWATSNALRRNKVPVAIFGGTADTVAAPRTYANVFYNAIPASSSKLRGIIRGADHSFATTASQPASYVSVAWMKRFVDNDARYSQFLNGDSRFAEFSSTGPF